MSRCKRALSSKLFGLYPCLAWVLLVSCMVGVAIPQEFRTKDRRVNAGGIEQSDSYKTERTSFVPLIGNWVNNQNAFVVLGQPGFGTNSPGTTLDKFSDPFGVTVDPVSGKVFVVETVNRRVLRFSSAAALLNGGIAEATFGGDGATAPNTMDSPRDVTIDQSGNLWVADQNNNRVLRFSGAATLASGSPADLVLGQSNLNSNAGPSPPTQSSMRLPSGIFADAGGHIWVADYGNHRVLRFDGAGTITSGAAASGVLGKSNFVTNTLETTQSGMRFPYGVSVDVTGRLWVAELQNNRVLRFDAAATLSNGANANGVLGQTNYTSGAPASPPTASSMRNPSGVSVDLAGTLYVTDGTNNRVLIYNTAASKANGATADNVLGQILFSTDTANNGGISGSSINTPAHPFFDEASQNLFIADSGNNRVLRFARTVATAANVVVSGRVLVPNGRGLINALVVMTDSAGINRYAQTGKGGRYAFEEVPAGGTFLISVKSRQFSYEPRFISVVDELYDIDFSPNISTNKLGARSGVRGLFTRDINTR